MKKKAVVVIGAGPAGLTAALDLLERGNNAYHVLILEAGDTVGGISRTILHNGNRMDIGGHRFFSKHPRVTQWWERILPLQGAPALDDELLGVSKQWAKNGPDPKIQDQVMLLRRRVSRIYYNRKFFDYPVSLKWQTLRNMGFFRTLQAGGSYLCAVIHKRNEHSLEDFYINRFGKVLYHMFFEGYTEKLWGRHPSQLSADWGAQRVKGLSIRAVLRNMTQKIFGRKHPSKQAVETSLIEEFWYPKLGPGQLWETVAKQIESCGGEIRFHCRAEQFQTQNGRLTKVIYRTEDGQLREESADFVLSSIPLQELVRGMEDTAPKKVADIAAGLPYRDFVTVGLLVDRLALTNQTKLPTLNNLIPDCWIYVQDTGVKLGRIQVFNNWSPYLVKDPLNTVWLGLEYFCREGDAFWNLSQKECVARATDELISMGVIAPDTTVMDCHRERVSKAYPAYFDTYSDINTLTAYLDTFENLYCIGRNGQHRYNNMDHSMLTAFAAVDSILSGNFDKTAVWNVNTEAVYHEERSEESDGKDQY